MCPQQERIKSLELLVEERKNNSPDYIIPALNIGQKIPNSETAPTAAAPPFEMFTRAALRCRIPPVRQFSLTHRTIALPPRFLLPGPRLFTSTTLRFNAATTEQHAPPKITQPELNSSNEPTKLVPPPYCPGCGAPSQQVDPNLPGYYMSKPTKSQRFGAGNLKVKTKKKKREDEIWEQALQRIKAEREATGKEIEGTKSLLELEPEEDAEKSAEEEFKSVKPQKDDLEEIAEAAEELEELKSQAPPPVCIRCHSMIHYHRAPPLPSYPTLDTLTNLLQSSPHKRNHIYHLIDAADLPMSLIQNLRNHLYTHLDREITRGLSISYVVTRSDLLMPLESQVKSLMTWIKKVVKDALPEGEKVEGREVEDRIHVVSARKGWGIGRIKQETKHREGGVWVVGAVNVGKSRLVREVWPEFGQGRAGSLEEANELDLLPEILEEVPEEEETLSDIDEAGPKETEANQAEPKEKQKQDRGFPLQVPPTVSDIPGTTAAPIRVVYRTAGTGGKKSVGELIDLPGLERWVGFGKKGLLPFVRDDKRKEFGMETKVNPEQYTIKPGQSMLIAGVIMITPKISPEDELVILAYPFTSLPTHITATRKALQLIADPDPANRPRIDLFQKPFQQTESPPKPNLAQYPPDETQVHPGSSNLPPHFKSAGTYTLSDDVTPLRNVSLPSKDPESLERLPYRIVATDILLEGIGWVELVAQVRRKKEENDGLKVQVEVFTPEGKGISSRTTMGADMLRKKGERAAGLARKSAGRPRRSMKGDKKRKKLAKRAGENQGDI